jgi:GAF domain-containing protein
MTEYDGQPGRDMPTDPGLTAEQSEADEDDLQTGLNGLAAMVAGARGVEELLTEVAEFAALAIPGVDGAGVTLIHPVGGILQIQAWAVTAGFLREIDILQYEVLGEGPCLTCMQTRRPVVSGSLGSDARWPRFGARVARLGVHSVVSMPLLIGDQVNGSINSYARERDAFGEHAVRLGTRFAGPAAVSLYNAQLLTATLTRERAEQLQRALGSRTVIDQAIGLIRGRTGGSAEEAFDELRRISQSENVKLGGHRATGARRGGARRPGPPPVVTSFRRDPFPACGSDRRRGRRVRARIRGRQPSSQLHRCSGFAVRSRRGQGCPVLRSFAGVPRRAAQRIRCPAEELLPGYGPRLSLSYRSAAGWRPRQQCLPVDPCLR